MCGSLLFIFRVPGTRLASQPETLGLRGSGIVHVGQNVTRT
ncbi:hypothetical protein FB99_15640 [Pantoea agglomerans]|nr:hypothetical protein FB99_15640 [Pantoea agglomerans]